MAQLIGPKKISCAVFISGNGSNLKSLIKFSKKKKLAYINKINCFRQCKSKRFKIWKNL